MHDHVIEGDVSNDANPLAVTFPSVQQGSTDIAAPGAATAAVVTYAGVPGKAHVLSGLAISYSAAPTGGNLIIQDGASTVFNVDIPAAGVYINLLQRPLKGTVGNAMTITLASGGGAVVGKLNCTGHYTE